MTFPSLDVGNSRDFCARPSTRAGFMELLAAISNSSDYCLSTAVQGVKGFLGHAGNVSADGMFFCVCRNQRAAFITTHTKRMWPFDVRSDTVISLGLLFVQLRTGRYLSSEL
jgi:hypothetical protein